MYKLRKCDLEAYLVWKDIREDDTNALCLWLSGVLNVKVVDYMAGTRLRSSAIYYINPGKTAKVDYVELCINSIMDDILEEYNA